MMRTVCFAWYPESHVKGRGETFGQCWAGVDPLGQGQQAPWRGGWVLGKVTGSVLPVAGFKAFDATCLGAPCNLTWTLHDMPGRQGGGGGFFLLTLICSR